MKDKNKIYSEKDNRVFDTLSSLQEQIFNAFKIAYTDNTKMDRAHQLMKQYIQLEKNCESLGTLKITKENGKIVKIYNPFLYNDRVKWFEYLPEGIASFGTYKGLLIFFNKIEYKNTKVICTDMMGNEDNSKYLYDKKGIKHLGNGIYEILLSQFVPLKQIEAPKEISVGDYFYSTSFGRGGIQFKPINEFSSNPWGGNIDSFVCNSVYSFKGFCGEWRGGTVKMIKSNDKLKELIKNASIWI